MAEPTKHFADRHAQLTYGTTTTINALLSNVFFVSALTGNIATLTISNPTNGQTINIRFVQRVLVLARLRFRLVVMLRPIPQKALRNEG